MPAAPAHSIGIDLGTTHCALAHAPMDGSGVVSRVLPIPQLESADTEIRDDVLPSFLYLPSGDDGPRKSNGNGGGGSPAAAWIAGRMARRRTTDAPGRVIHSAKSWLANHAVAPDAPILPANSAEMAEEQRVSPIDASAALLAHLRRAWEAAFARESGAPRFADQWITVTVPASFDAAAQRATLEAAVRAGFPADSTRLLEEPQAAFHCYLEARGRAADASLPKKGGHILVVDIGGGTSDFSLFRVQSTNANDDGPALARVAVSEHILLGGDNMDLATAHVLEGALLPDGGSVTGASWDHLLARAREIKENALDDASAAGSGTETLRVAIPGMGSGLLTGTLSAEIPAAQLREILLDGFFPLVPRDAMAERDRSALREWGLPYASDFAATRYLAEFLRDQPVIDAVLFNGGSLSAALVRQRLLDQIAAWQDGLRPAVLENPRPALAVARGAAFHGRLLREKKPRIEAAAARAVFLETSVAGEDGGVRAVCVLPRGTPPGGPVRVGVPGLRVRVNQPVRFQVVESPRHNAGPGETARVSGGGWIRLPPLETEIRRPGAPPGASVDAGIEATLNELGLLRVQIAENGKDENRWPLEFNLRESAPGHAASSGVTAQTADVARAVDAARLARAQDALPRAPGRRRGRGHPTPAKILKRIAVAMDAPPHEWPLPAVRHLAHALFPPPDVSSADPQYLETWFHLAGFFLRPGFGDARDPQMIDLLWKQFGDLGGGQLPRRVVLQILILWRRLAPGLSAARQTALLGRCRPKLTHPTRGGGEHIRLAGALERIPADEKTRLARAFLHSIDRAARRDGGGDTVAWIDSVGRLLNRTPFHAPETHVPSPESVEEAFRILRRHDPAQPPFQGLPTLFLRAARKIENHSLNVPPKPLRSILAFLRKAGVPETRLATLREVIPPRRDERAELYSESLPPGLLLDFQP